MKERDYWQCQTCGEIFCADVQVNIEGLYTNIECPRCRGVTNCLWVGNQPDDIYKYYNLNVDPRYYEYKHKTK